jgi:hypothetical protein
VSQILAVFSVLKELIKFIKAMIDFADRKRLADALERELALAQAVKDLKVAETDEAIFDAQARIVKNSK